MVHFLRQSSVCNKPSTIRLGSLAASMLLAFTLGAGWLLPVSAQSATIIDRSLKLSDSLPGAVGQYEIGFTAAAMPVFGSVKVEFCSNTALFEVICNSPLGFDISAANLIAQAGDIGFSVHPSTTASILILTRPTSPASGSPSTYTLSNIRNAASTGSQYARYSMYASHDGTGTTLDKGSIAYSLNPLFGVSSEVPPYLEFCAGANITTMNCNNVNGSNVPLGDFSTQVASTGKTQMVVGTNAASGYTIRVNGKTMISGTNVIPALSTPTLSAPGRSQFGINLRSNTNPAGGENPSGSGLGTPADDYNISNKYVFRPGDILAGSNTTEDYRKYTVSYMVNIDRNQSPGIYSGTYTYVALGNF